MRVALLPLGEVPPAVLEGLSRSLDERGISCEVLGPSPLPDDAYRAGRRQYDADLVLASVSQSAEDRTLAVTEADLFVEGMNFVFGLARIGGASALVSFHRLGGEGPERLATRLVKECVHELGHAWGLGHCETPGCVMQFSNSLAEADAKGDAFCGHCRQRLRSPSVSEDEGE